MFALFLVLGIAAATASPSPMPTNPFTLDPGSPAARLPVIGRTHSRALCTALRRSIAPALALTHKNDASFTDSRKMIFKYLVQNEGLGKDYTLFRLDQVTIANIQKNLDAYDKLLDDPALVPQSATNSDDAKVIDDLKKRSRALRAAQELEYNALSGFLETERMQRFRTKTETEQTMATALGLDSLPTASGEQKVVDDYYNYFHGQRGRNTLGVANSIDHDLDYMQTLSLRDALALQQVALDASKNCRP